MTTQHVFYVDPARPCARIREKDMEIKVCAKMTWAIEPRIEYREGGYLMHVRPERRHLLGSTAFFTRKAAERVKLAHLQKLAEQQPSYFNADRVFRARQILKDYRETGTLQ